MVAGARTDRMYWSEEWAQAMSEADCLGMEFAQGQGVGDLADREEARGGRPDGG